MKEYSEKDVVSDAQNVVLKDLEFIQNGKGNLI